MSTTPHRTVLIIDDDPTIRALLDTFLTDEGYVVFQAGDGKQAMLLACEHQPSVILLEGVLPELSGLEILRMLRAGGATRHIPVVMLNGRPPSGADEPRPEIFIGKPFDLEVLLTHVNRMVALNEAPEPVTAS
jgi:DNA-binding response OmpR family regulator